MIFSFLANVYVLIWYIISFVFVPNFSFIALFLNLAERTGHFVVVLVDVCLQIYSNE